MFDTFVHGLVGVAHAVDEYVRIYVDERVVHPSVIPFLPVCCCDPQVFERFKFTSQPGHLIILCVVGRKMYLECETKTTNATAEATTSTA